MSLRIKTVVDKFVEELKEALDADIQDRIMKERALTQCQELMKHVAILSSQFAEMGNNAADHPSVIQSSTPQAAHVVTQFSPLYPQSSTFAAFDHMAEAIPEPAEIARQEARLKMEKENLEKEKSVLMGTASNQDNQDGALEITVSGEKYRCLRFAKAKK
ncbi:hypothetical protein CFP56_015439 [Quercus suber]|uniref:Uncharacterized protein n=1 Tax=Quercus suber TaxID=58331 RepID=A0AAW0KPX5_QUESU